MLPADYTPYVASARRWYWLTQQRRAMTRLPEGVDPAHLGDPTFRPAAGDLLSGPESGSGTDFDPGAP